MKKIYLAAGCYWGVEALFRRLEGVLDTTVGFTGGEEKYTSYEEVKTGLTGHAETLEVVYDESKVSLRELLIYFFRIHDPTTLNRQKNDIGTQYRSAIFSNDDSELNLAKELIEDINKTEYFNSEIVTKLEALNAFFPAEESHQDYLEKNPLGYNCHLLGPEIPI